MTYYKIIVQTARDVHNPGTPRQHTSGEYIHSIIVQLTMEDSSWLPFIEAKKSAIAYINKFTNTHEMNLEENTRSTRKLQRLESIDEEKLRSLLKEGQKIITL
ncbi:MAG: hypothetical protein WCP55_10760 [Lentisphaerota bacterium]